MRGKKGFLAIPEEKELNRGSYRDFVKAKQPIDLGKIKVPLPRDFYQASCGVEGFSGQGGERT